MHVVVGIVGELKNVGREGAWFNSMRIGREKGSPHVPQFGKRGREESMYCYGLV